MNHWPSHLWLVGPGEAVPVTGRDHDAPLSAVGERQVGALAQWFTRQSDRPTLVFTSPFECAVQTGRLLGERAGLHVRSRRDERLRDIEPGSLAGYTHAGMVARFPYEAESRTRLGKFYYRPPGGESWCDVIMRVRSVVRELEQFGNERVLVVSHPAVLMAFRYVIEDLSEHAVLELDRGGAAGSCAVTEYQRMDTKLNLTATDVATSVERAALH